MIQTGTGRPEDNMTFITRGRIPPHFRDRKNTFTLHTTSSICEERQTRDQEI